MMVFHQSQKTKIISVLVRLKFSNKLVYSCRLTWRDIAAEFSLVAEVEYVLTLCIRICWSFPEKIGAKLVLKIGAKSF